MEKKPFAPAPPAARRLALEQGIEWMQVKGTGPDGRITEADVLRFAEERAKAADILASPMAKKLAQEHGIDLAQVKGMGAGGRITEKDVLAFVESRQAYPERSRRALPSARPPGAPPQAIPFIGMRQAVAQRMTESLQSMAQVTLLTEADVTEMVRLRERLKQRFDLTYTDIIVKAVATALKEHPLLNAALIGEEIQLLPEIHIGVAVALEDGLIVPVVRDADRKSLQDIAQDTGRLAEGARAGSPTGGERTGGTFPTPKLGDLRGGWVHAHHQPAGGGYLRRGPHRGETSRLPGRHRQTGNEGAEPDL